MQISVGKNLHQPDVLVPKLGASSTEQAKHVSDFDVHLSEPGLVLTPKTFRISSYLQDY